MGFCTTSLQRAAGLLLAVGVAACEQSAPAPFDAAGASADAAAVHEVFATSLLGSLDFAAAEIDRQTGGTAVDAAASSVASGPGSFRRLSRLLANADAPPSLSAGELPSEVTGRTFELGASSGTYVMSELSGAPPDGVRFQLYAIEPGSGTPALPVTQVGYVDVVGEGPGEVQIRVADLTGVRLEYRVSASGVDAERRVQVAGFAIHGASRADFAFENTLELTGSSSGQMRLRQALDLAGRQVELDCASALLVRAGLAPELQLGLTLRGPNGEVDMAGAYELGGTGTLAVEVNGERYAAVQLSGSEYEVAGAGMDPLPESALLLLDRMIGTRDSGLEIFDRLVRPVEGLIAP
jgi:hypothetical protein